MISAIVAVDNDWGIGYNGNLLEYIPEDLRNFRQLTTGHTIIMGRKTWDSLPKKPLPNRVNIVISKDEPTILDKNTLRLHLESIMDYLKYTEDDVFIIGGESIYKELFSFCDRIYVTKIYKNHKNIDTYFPNLDNMDSWGCTRSSYMFYHNDIPYQFCQYDKLI